MEIYTARLVKARAIQSEMLHEVLRRYYPTAWDFMPVSLLLEATSFRLAEDADRTQQDVCEKDPELGRLFSTMMLDVLIPGQVVKVNKAVPAGPNQFINLAEAYLWLGGEYRLWTRHDKLQMEWGCEYLFTKRRADGSTRRHAPPHIGGRVLHELKYPKFIGIIDPSAAAVEDVSNIIVNNPDPVLAN